ESEATGKAAQDAFDRDEAQRERREEEQRRADQAATTPSRRRRKPRTALRTGRRIPRPAATREATSRPGLTRAARTDPDPLTDDPRAEPRRAGIVHVDARPSAEPQ